MRYTSDHAHENSQCQDTITPPSPYWVVLCDNFGLRYRSTFERSSSCLSEVFSGCQVNTRWKSSDYRAPIKREFLSTCCRIRYLFLSIFSLPILCPINIFFFFSYCFIRTCAVVENRTHKMERWYTSHPYSGTVAQAVCLDFYDSRMYDDKNAKHETFIIRYNVLRKKLSKVQ